jgi:hypothetical protein
MGEFALSRILGFHVPDWNDTSWNTKEEVVATFREAAARARA